MRNKKIMKYVWLTIIISLVFILIKNSTVCAKINTEIGPITADTQFQKLGNGILGTVQVIGIFVAVAGLMIIGIKYMLGSAEEKSEQKQILIYYLIGSIMVISIVKVVELIYSFSSGLF